MMEIFSLPFMRTALLVSVVAGNAVAVVGTFVLMRRVAFSGLAVSQLAALGGVIGVLLNMHNAFVAALGLVFAGLFLLARLERFKRIPQEAWVAALYVLGAATAVLLLAKSPRGESETLNVFFGNILTLGSTEIIEALVLLGITVPTFALFFHKWVWMSFDPQSSEVSGIAIKKWDVYFFALTALAMTVAIHLFGVLLAFAYLILPGTVALLVARRAGWMFVAVPVVTTLATLVGFLMSFHWDLPTGPFVSALLAALVAVSGVATVAMGRR